MARANAEWGGNIRIGLDLLDGRVMAIRIDGRETDGVAPVFVGRAVSEVPGRIGSIFSLCGTAQAIAALSAIESALGIAVGPQVRAARDALRMTEMLSQTAMRLALHWPAALDLPTDPALVRACMTAQKELETALFKGANWKRPGEGIADISPPDVEWLADMITAFCAQSRLPAALDETGFAGFGALPHGMTPEQGAFQRQWDHPKVQNTREAHGNALAARLAAGMADLASLPDRIQTALSQIAPAPTLEPVTTTGTGEAVVETARGDLHHTVEVEEGLVTAYRIDAPTELNFRSGGPVEAGLIGAGAGGIELAARLHVLAIDPCVDFTVEVRHA